MHAHRHDILRFKFFPHIVSDDRRSHVRPRSTSNFSCNFYFKIGHWAIILLIDIPNIFLRFSEVLCTKFHSKTQEMSWHFRGSIFQNFTGEYTPGPINCSRFLRLSGKLTSAPPKFLTPYVRARIQEMQFNAIWLKQLTRNLSYGVCEYRTDREENLTSTSYNYISKLCTDTIDQVLIH
jgi:hypothetical protein